MGALRLPSLAFLRPPSAATRPWAHFSSSILSSHSPLELRSIRRDSLGRSSGRVSTQSLTKEEEQQQEVAASRKATQTNQEWAVTPRSLDFNTWFHDVIASAELADYGPIRGSMVFCPYPIQKRHCSALAGKEVNNEGSEHKEKITVTFVDKDGDENVIQVPIGMSMLEAAHENDIELEGACEGSLACSTCHVIVMDVDYYNKLEDPTDEENDMLDLAFGLTETSRLGCQVIAKPELDGLRLALPAATRNFAVDGYVPKPH